MPSFPPFYRASAQPYEGLQPHNSTSFHRNSFLLLRLYLILLKLINILPPLLPFAIIYLHLLSFLIQKYILLKIVKNFWIISEFVQVVEVGNNDGQLAKLPHKMCSSSPTLSSSVVVLISPKISQLSNKLGSFNSKHALASTYFEPKPRWHASDLLKQGKATFCTKSIFILLIMICISDWGGWSGYYALPTSPSNNSRSRLSTAPATLHYIAAIHYIPHQWNQHKNLKIVATGWRHLHLQICLGYHQIVSS